MLCVICCVSYVVCTSSSVYLMCCMRYRRAEVHTTYGTQHEVHTRYDTQHLRCVYLIYCMYLMCCMRYRRGRARSAYLICSVSMCNIMHLVCVSVPLTHTYTHLCVRSHTHTHICVYVCVSAHTHRCVYVCVSVPSSVCMCDIEQIWRSLSHV